MDSTFSSGLKQLNLLLAINSNSVKMLEISDGEDPRCRRPVIPFSSIQCCQLYFVKIAIFGLKIKILHPSSLQKFEMLADPIIVIVGNTALLQMKFL